MSLKKYKKFIDDIMPDLNINVTDKHENVSSMIMYTFLRLQEMFEYKNLPKSIPAQFLEFYLQVNGHCAIIQHEGELYAVKGGFGGDPDPYYVPTLYVVANPYLKLSKTFVRDEDCIVLQNDAMYYGLFPLVSKYSGLMAENEISMNMSVINSRIMSLITANTDEEKASADKFINDVIEGKLSAVANSPFFDGIRTQPYANAAQANAITNLIEYEQYLKASLFNELGLNANYNMKRESINSNESQLNDDMLTPLIDDMLRFRKEGIKKVNDMFGTDISVDFNSAWKENELTAIFEMENMKDDNSGDNTLDNSDFDSVSSGSTETDLNNLEEIKEDLEEKEGEENV